MAFRDSQRIQTGDVVIIARNCPADFVGVRLTLTQVKHFNGRVYGWVEGSDGWGTYIPFEDLAVAPDEETTVTPPPTKSLDLEEAP